MISCSTCVNGCRLPSVCFLPGMVISMVSAWSVSASAASCKAVCFSLMADSMSARTVLASCPITGRSSADSFPICFKIPVMAPFFPRYLTRTASSSLASLQALSSSCALLRMASSCSFIVFSSFQMIMVHKRRCCMK